MPSFPRPWTNKCLSSQTFLAWKEALVPPPPTLFFFLKTVQTLCHLRQGLYKGVALYWPIHWGWPSSRWWAAAAPWSGRGHHGNQGHGRACQTPLPFWWCSPPSHRNSWTPTSTSAAVHAPPENKKFTLQLSANACFIASTYILSITFLFLFN